MLDAYRSGDDPAVVLPVLSTWMGHSEPRDTYWYWGVYLRADSGRMGQ